MAQKDNNSNKNSIDPITGERFTPKGAQYGSKLKAQAGTSSIANAVSEGRSRKIS